MRQRCNNPNKVRYADYGGRGIKVCDDWDNYPTFKNWAISNGYDDTMSIERVDVDKDYCPTNCKWIPLSDQSKNRRSCNMLTYNGKTLTISDWARELNIHRSTINKRLKKGMSIDKVLSK